MNKKQVAIIVAVTLTVVICCSAFSYVVGYFHGAYDVIDALQKEMDKRNSGVRI